MCVLYADIKGFTRLAKRLRPRGVMRLLNCLYTVLDQLAPQYDVLKIETIGDCYVAASGLDLKGGGLVTKSHGRDDKGAV